MRQPSFSIAIFMIGIICTSSTIAWGQNDPGFRNEFTITAGFFSNRSLQSNDKLLPVPGAVNFVQRDVTSVPAIFLTFQRALHPRFILGFTVGSASERGMLSNDDLQRRASYSWRTYAFAAEARYLYLDRRLVRLYAMAGAGPHIYRQETFFNQKVGSLYMTTEQSTEVELGTAYQVTPFGIRFGGYRFGAVAEFGFGYKGILNVGASVRF